MALANQAKDLRDYINEHKHYLARNVEVFDIYEGNLRPYVDEILRATLSEQYYSKIKSRILPINILRRYSDKVAQAYKSKPSREASSNQDTLNFYENMFRINRKMNAADEFTSIFRGYALEPYISDGVPQLRTLPYDRFLVRGTDPTNPLKVTEFYKYVGKVKKKTGSSYKEVDLWFIYTDSEFLAMDSDGDIVPQYMEDNEGVNVYGFIPFFYGNRSEYSLLPTQETDLLAMTKMIPVQFSDLGGAIMFSIFSITYGIDVDSENLIMAPNAFWSFQSDSRSEKTPQIGTIKPSADINETLNFIRETFATWLETKGIKVGSMGSLNGGNAASGVAKIIDEMDTYDQVKKSIEIFKTDEYRFWRMLGKMHNKWLEMGELQGVGRLPDDWEVFTLFDEPKPLIDRSTEVDTKVKEVNAGFISRETAMTQLYPDWSEERIEDEMRRMDEQQMAGFVPIGRVDNTAGNDDN